MHALAPSEGVSGTEPGSEVSEAYSAMTEDGGLSMAYEDASTQEAAGDDADTVLHESARRLNDHFRPEVPPTVLYDEKQSRVWVCTRAADGATGFVVKLSKASVSVPAGVEVSNAKKLHRRMAARELSILRKLDSDYLVRLEDSFVNDGFLYTVFRRFFGGNLHDVYDQRFYQNAPFSDADVRAVATRLLRALEYLHFNLRVVHRDIKCVLCAAAVPGRRAC
jgi:serine/threonine protein kinase